ncbi:MAG: hypothetical protein E7037_01685 [Verrucomicrobia bacterium]|nr:hypothetical protein [Verrucomicrobiota bacterium]
MAKNNDERKTADTAAEEQAHADKLTNAGIPAAEARAIAKRKFAARAARDAKKAEKGARD